ncbi:MAG: hypothetical protein KGL39_45850 [Patescibacteria group bacterium]|nr:hypothetical protein [Patescibacteria group bacterium]
MKGYEPASIWTIWDDLASGLKVAIQQNSLGLFCGYVMIPEGHSYFCVHYQELEDYYAVHGGLTFSGVKLPSGDGPEGWWIGFDCAHCDDFELDVDDDDEYSFESRWTIEMVVKEVEHLAQQVIESAQNGNQVNALLDGFGTSTLLLTDGGDDGQKK